MANQKKPGRLKLIAGTKRKCRETKEIDLPLLGDSPPAPDWLPNAHAVKEWDRLVKILMANKMLTGADLSTLGHLCSLHGKIVQQYAAGTTPTASMMGALRGLLSDFGLSPVARGKVSPSATGGKGVNPFDNNGKRGA